MALGREKKNRKKQTAGWCMPRRATSGFSSASFVFRFAAATFCMTISEGIERDVFFKLHKGGKSAFFIASSSRPFSPPWYFSALTSPAAAHKEAVQASIMRVFSRGGVQTSRCITLKNFSHLGKNQQNSPHFCVLFAFFHSFYFIMKFCLTLHSCKKTNPFWEIIRVRRSRSADQLFSAVWAADDRTRLWKLRKLLKVIYSPRLTSARKLLLLFISPIATPPRSSPLPEVESFGHVYVGRSWPAIKCCCVCVF